MSPMTMFLLVLSFFRQGTAAEPKPPVGPDRPRALVESQVGDPYEFLAKKPTPRLARPQERVTVRGCLWQGPELTPEWCGAPLPTVNNSHIESAHDEHDAREIRVMPPVFMK